MEATKKSYTISEVRDLLIKQAEKEAGKNIDQIIKSIPLVMEYGQKEGGRKFSDFSIIYIDNVNYATGSGWDNLRNGRGWYFKAYFTPGACNYIKFRSIT